MKNFLIALQFLTILPIKICSRIKEEDYARSLLYFPIVGMLIGLVLAFSLLVLNFLPIPVTSALILAISIVITGGVHLDGFSDTCDGFYGGKTKEEILKIMRDSHAGPMGVIGIAVLLLLKFTLLYSIPFNTLWKALIIMPVWGRFSQVLSCSFSNYARENGKAKFFIEYITKRELIPSGIFTFALTIFLMKLSGFIETILLSTAILFFIGHVKHKIGGMTGDTIGAISEITEVFVLFLVLLSLKITWLC